MSTMRPVNPCSRSVCAAVAPARLAPTMTNVELRCIWSGSFGASGVCEGEELRPRARVVAKQAMHRGGDGAGTPRPDTAQRHAQVLGLHHDAYASGRKVGLQPVGDLFGQPFLDLRAAGEHLDHARQLRQPKDPAAWDVADMRDAHK